MEVSKGVGLQVVRQPSESFNVLRRLSTTSFPRSGPFNVQLLTNLENGLDVVLSCTSAISYQPVLDLLMLRILSSNIHHGTQLLTPSFLNIYRGLAHQLM